MSEVVKEEIDIENEGETVYKVNNHKINATDKSRFEDIPSAIENSKRLKQKAQTEKEEVKSHIDKLKRAIEDLRKSNQKPSGQPAQSVEKKPQQPTPLKVQQESQPKLNETNIKAPQGNIDKGSTSNSLGASTNKNQSVNISPTTPSASNTSENIKQAENPLQQSGGDKGAVDDGGLSMLEQDLAFYTGALTELPTIESRIDENLSTMESMLHTGTVQGYTFLTDFQRLPSPSEREDKGGTEHGQESEKPDLNTNQENQENSSEGKTDSDDHKNDNKQKNENTSNIETPQDNLDDNIRNVNTNEPENSQKLNDGAGIENQEHHHIPNEKEKMRNIVSELRRRPATEPKRTNINNQRNLDFNKLDLNKPKDRL